VNKLQVTEHVLDLLLNDQQFNDWIHERVLKDNPQLIPDQFETDEIMEWTYYGLSNELRMLIVCAAMVQLRGIKE